MKLSEEDNQKIALLRFLPKIEYLAKKNSFRIQNNVSFKNKNSIKIDKNKDCHASKIEANGMNNKQEASRHAKAHHRER